MFFNCFKFKVLFVKPFDITEDFYLPAIKNFHVYLYGVQMPMRPCPVGNLLYLNHSIVVVIIGILCWHFLDSCLLLSLNNMIGFEF